MASKSVPPLTRYERGDLQHLIDNPAELVRFCRWRLVDMVNNSQPSPVAIRAIELLLSGAGGAEDVADTFSHSDLELIVNEYVNDDVQTGAD